MATRPQKVQALHRRVVWTMAVASGAAAANLYYNQPLLPDIARTFGVPDHAVGLIPTLTQIGYGIGMLLVVPLGDSHERRKLVLTLTGLVTLALLGAAAAPSLCGLGLAGGASCATTSIPQVVACSTASRRAHEFSGAAALVAMSGGCM